MLLKTDNGLYFIHESTLYKFAANVVGDINSEDVVGETANVKMKGRNFIPVRVHLKTDKPDSDYSVEALFVETVAKI